MKEIDMSYVPSLSEGFGQIIKNDVSDDALDNIADQVFAFNSMSGFLDSLKKHAKSKGYRFRECEDLPSWGIRDGDIVFYDNKKTTFSGVFMKINELLSVSIATMDDRWPALEFNLLTEEDGGGRRYLRDGTEGDGKMRLAVYFKDYSPLMFTRILNVMSNISEMDPQDLESALAGGRSIVAEIFTGDPDPKQTLNEGFGQNVKKESSSLDSVIKDMNVPEGPLDHEEIVKYLSRFIKAIYGIEPEWQRVRKEVFKIGPFADTFVTGPFGIGNVAVFVLDNRVSLHYLKANSLNEREWNGWVIHPHDLLLDTNKKGAVYGTPMTQDTFLKIIECLYTLHNAKTDLNEVVKDAAKAIEEDNQNRWIMASSRLWMSDEDLKWLIYEKEAPSAITRDDVERLATTYDKSIEALKMKNAIDESLKHIPKTISTSELFEGVQVPEGTSRKDLMNARKLYDYLIESSKNAEFKNESLDDQIDEGLLSGLLGGTIGAAVGPAVMKAVCRILGISEGGTLGKLLTSSLVCAAVGAEIGY